ncbi:hypothetical protein PGB34_16430 [Xenophilus arseniciresistens]|uniref:DUF4412 domain-containing protein n=1 Tax=Xenophilus arseniciresistens TaxID=1283306 RepID=A0AAE3T211_9BURK|nr:hypothetical protein [Xenophilus arseniciresistens]MDA7417952.1 hypothetical protein [Xenophilus arseniciresistens]
MKRRHFAASAALATLAPWLAAPAPARSLMPPPIRTRTGRLMQLSVLDRDSGRELPLHFHEGEYWVAGRPGARYALRVHNLQGERLLAVMSVDGLNVLTGQRASVDQGGYVLDGGERADVAGWRKSDDQIAAFEFTAPGDAYATRTGRPEHLGVIGLALFRERAPLPPPAVASRSEEARAPWAADAARAEAPAASTARQAERSRAPAGPAPQLGTGHGAREHAPVSRTQFTRAQSRPDELIRVRYDSRENLIARGVIPAPRPSRPQAPQPFPASPSEMGYVPDPPPRR